MTLYILHAAIAATAVACALAAFLFVLAGWASDFWLAFRQRVLANVFAISTIPPLIVLTAAGELVGAQASRRRRYVELGLLTMGLLATGPWSLAGGASVSEHADAAPGAAAVAAVGRGPFGVGRVEFFPLGVCRGGPVERLCRPRPLRDQFAGGERSLFADLPSRNLHPADDPDGSHRGASARGGADAGALEAARRGREELAHVLRVATFGELTASIAHEVNQPLAAIKMNAQAALRLLGATPAEPAPARAALADIAQDADRASQIIRRIRALFRKEHEQHVAVDINTLIEDVLGLLSADIERRRIVVRFERGEALPAVLGDAVQLQQVVLNVIVNACEAVDATGVGPHGILIETTQPHRGRLTLAVRDSGIGVKEAELERIFEHFVSSKPQGLGMGLAISRSIVEAHWGRISATANADMGLTVHVELPVHADQVSE